MLQELEHLGVGFVSLTEALHLTIPAGRAMAGLLAVFAAFEREILGERVRAGLAHARQNGKRLGRPASAARHTAEVRKLHRAGVSKSEIARRLKIGRTSGWYYYLDDKIRFPFQARCIAAKIVSPLRKSETVEVQRMALQDACSADMLVLIRWHDRTMAVPLSQLVAVDPDDSTAETIGVPVGARRFLPKHEVHTVVEMQWPDQLENGELLKMAEARVST
jgi:hypothetical protein